MARERALTSCARRANRRRITRTRSSGAHTPSSSPAHNNLASVRASSRSVFARAWRIPVSLGETTITLATCASRIRAIAHALPVTSNATQSLASRLCANNSNVSGPRLDPARRAQPALLDDRHLTEVAMDVQRYRSHPSSSPSIDVGRTGGQTTSTDPRSQRNQASRRGGHRKARAQSPSRKTACPTCVLPKAPVPVNRSYVGHRMTPAPSTSSFMPRIAGATAALRETPAPRAWQKWMGRGSTRSLAPARGRGSVSRLWPCHRSFRVRKIGGGIYRRGGSSMSLTESASQSTKASCCQS